MEKSCNYVVRALPKWGEEVKKNQVTSLLAEILVVPYTTESDP